MFQTIVVEKIRTCLLQIFFSKLLPFVR